MFERTRALKQKFRAGDLTFGAWMEISHFAVAEIMAQTGFDFVVIDTEHGAFHQESLAITLAAFGGQPTVPIVRVPWNDKVMIKHTLDAGAEGILVPWVKDAGQVSEAVAACKYPPDGVRGFGPWRASRYYREVEEYARDANEALVTVTQLEHIDAADEIEDILAVPGLDAVAIGPFDMSGSAGILGQTKHPTVQGAIERIAAAAKARGVPVCMGTGMPLDDQRKWVAKGVNMVVAVDVLELLTEGTTAALAGHKEALGIA